MSIYTKIARLAKKFEAVYPQELPERLEWWCNVLGIDRPRLLRMLGMSRRQAVQRAGEELREVLKNAKWGENARVLVEALHRLVSFYHYDWQLLAKSIHEQGKTAREGAAGGTPRNVSEALLARRLDQGGSEVIFAVFAYLVDSQAANGRGES